MTRLMKTTHKNKIHNKDCTIRTSTKALVRTQQKATRIGDK